MTQQNDSEREKHYRFEGRWRSPLGAAVMMIFFLYFIGLAAYQGNTSVLVYLIFSCAFIFCLWLFLLSFYAVSPTLIIDDIGIKRFIYRMVIQNYSWSQIEKIRQLVVYNKYKGRLTTQFIVYPYKNFRKGIKYTISFNERVMDGLVDDMLDALNKRIKEHNIKIEEGSSGLFNKWREVDHLHLAQDRDRK